jgi:hypothetical protein
MTPRPTTQQDLDLLERLGKYVGSLVVIGGAATAVVRWLRRRKAARDAAYASRIEKIVRAQFSKEIGDLSRAAVIVENMAGQVTANTGAIADIATAIVGHLAVGDETLGLVLDYVRENREWLDDLQTFVDHAYGIDRRASVGQDRRQRSADKLDALERRRAERRRIVDPLRQIPHEPHIPLIPPTDHGEVT